MSSKAVMVPLDLYADLEQRAGGDTSKIPAMVVEIVRAALEPRPHLWVRVMRAPWRGHGWEITDDAGDLLPHHALPHLDIGGEVLIGPVIPAPADVESVRILEDHR